MFEWEQNQSAGYKSCKNYKPPRTASSIIEEDKGENVSNGDP